MDTSIFERLVEASAQGENYALGIITGVKGSSPQKIGAKAIFYADGRIDGTLGGGCLEAEIQDRARRSILTQNPATFELVLDHDFGWDDGLVCGGKVSGVILPHASNFITIWKGLAARVEPLAWGIARDFSIGWMEDASKAWIYKEEIRPPCALWVAGAGHVAQAVVPIAIKLDFAVLVMDDRPALANHHYFPKATRFRVGAWEDILNEPMAGHSPTFGLIVTRGHRHDALVLREWIRHPFAFLGMIGSRRKWRLISSQFLEQNLASEEQLAQVACPVGIDINGVTVPEIAVSIIAQYVQKRARLLREAPAETLAPGSQSPLSFPEATRPVQAC